jgi:dTDP-4-amino-4,6-dideoxygalactose transaminase
MCAHLETPYAAAWPVGCLPQSESASDSGIVLPLSHDLSEADIRWIARSLQDALTACGAWPGDEQREAA